MKPKNKRILASVFKWILILIVAFIILLPLLWIFTSSISPADELFSSPIHYIPKHPTLDNYIRIFTQMNLGEKILNTAIITVCSLILSTVICLMSAYAFTRYSGKGLTLVYAAIVASALIPGIVTARPLYDLMNTSALIPFTMLILGNFLSEIPVSMDEAAEIDGANMFQKLFYITLPLMKPAIATILIINFINCLNDLFTPLFFAQKIEVLSVAITTIPRETSYSMPWDLISTVGCVILLPIVIFVLIFEKQIMEGVMAGGVKQ